MINAFGAGGAYANLIVEAYDAQAVVKAPPQEVAAATDALLIFSAKTRSSLLAYLQKMVDFIAQNPALPLAAVARSAAKLDHGLTWRAALVARDRAQALAQLQQLLQAGSARPQDGVYLGTATNLDRHSPGRAQVEEALAQGDRRQLARLWMAGEQVPWSRLYASSAVWQPLPKYVFDHPASLQAQPGQAASEKAAQPNQSDFDEAYFLDLATQAVAGNLTPAQFEDLLIARMDEEHHHA